ncbi:TPA: hypothetical protein L7N09_003738 [Klebsiella pneumoniae]|nr:hypothetical protein [Klebsiella pneumoniae]
MAKDCCAELTLDDKDQDDERLYLTCTSKHIGPDVIEQRRDETSEGLKWKKNQKNDALYKYTELYVKN